VVRCGALAAKKDSQLDVTSGVIAVVVAVTGSRDANGGASRIIASEE
jgi:hypothetical protein